MVDEVTKYMAYDISSAGIERVIFMEYYFFAVTFWYSHKYSFPSLFPVTYRVYETPATSCAREWVWSTLKNVVSNDRANLGNDILENIVIGYLYKEK